MRIKQWTFALILTGMFWGTAQAMTVSWDFSWTRNQYSGSGSFSYDTSAAWDFTVTHGYAPPGFFSPGHDVPDELLEFSFTGYENGVSLGTTDALPGYFSFSPVDPNAGIVWAVRANTDGSDGSTGVGCQFQFCSIFMDGDLIRASTAVVNLRGGVNGGLGGGILGALPEPGTLGMTTLGLLLIAFLNRRRAKA